MGERFGMQRDVIQIPLVAGHDQSASEYSEETGSPRLQLVLNAEYTRKNKIAKRHGFERSTTNSYSGDLCRLINYKDSLFGVDSDGLVEQMVVQSECVQNTLNTVTDTTFYLPELMNEKSVEISRFDYQAHKVDIASSSLYDVIVYSEDEKVYALIKNREHGTLVQRYEVYGGTSGYTVGDVKISANTTTDGYFCVIWSLLSTEGEGDELLMFKILDLREPDTDSWSFSNQIAATVETKFSFDTDTGGVGFDITPQELGGATDGWAIVWRGKYTFEGLVSGLIAKTIYLNGTTRVAETVLSSDSWYGVSILQSVYDTSAWLHITTWKSDGLYYTARNASSLVLVQAPENINSLSLTKTDRLPAIMWRGPTKQEIYVYYLSSVEYDEDYPANGINIGTGSTASIPFVAGTGVWFRYSTPRTRLKSADLIGMHPISKGFKCGDRMYAWMADYTSRTAYLIHFPDTNDGLPQKACRVVTQCAFNTTWAGAHSKLMNVSKISDTEFTTGARIFLTPLIGESLNNPNTDYAVGFAKFRTYKDPEYSYQTEIVEDTAYISGGLLMNYDGNLFQENNFVQIPQIFVDETYHASDPFETGIYSYVLVYEFMDSNGNRHRSVPSKPVAIDVQKTLHSQTMFLSPNASTDIVGTAATYGRIAKPYWFVEIKVTNTGTPGTGKIQFRVPDGEWGDEATIAVPPLKNTWHGWEFLFKNMEYTNGTVYYVNNVEPEGKTKLDLNRLYIDFNYTGENNKFRYTFEYNASSPEDSPWFDNDGSGYNVHTAVDKDGYFHFTSDGYVNDYSITHTDSLNETGLKAYFHPQKKYYEDTWVDVYIGSRTRPLVSFPPNLYTYRHNEKCILSVYRTLKNGEIYYRLANWEDVSTWSMQGGSLINDPLEVSKLRYSFYDSVRDEDLQYNEILYSQPDGTGVLPNDHPYGGVKCIKFHKNRLFMSSAENPCQVMYTKEYERGTPLSYSLGQDIFVPEPVTGFAAHDEKLVIFTRKGIYILLGSGPDATGDPRTGSFELIQLTNAPGCSTPRSIQSIEQGTFYHSPAGGIKFLTKGNSVHDIGSSISDSYMDGGSIIYDSVNVCSEDKQYILYYGRFAFHHLMINYSDMSAPSGGAARMSFWSSYVTHSTDNLSCSYLGFCNDTLYMANVYNNNSKLLNLSRTKYTDVGQVNISTPPSGYAEVYHPLWIHTGYLNLVSDAQTRVRKVSFNGYMTNNGALLTVYNSSFNNGKSDQRSWGSNEVSDITTRDLNLVHTIRYQKGRAFRFEFSTVTPEPNEGVLPDPGKAEFYSITIELGGKKPIQERQIGKTA